MKIEDVGIGLEVVRTKGDYVVGRTGPIVEINGNTKRVRVAWKGETKTWVSIDAVESTSIPYEIIPIKLHSITGRLISYPKYNRI